MATHPQKSRILKSLALGLAGVMVLWLAAGPGLGVGWHLIHGNHFNYGGLTVFVPRHSYVRYTASGPVIQTLSAGAPMFNRPFGTIFISRAMRPFSKQEHYPAFVEEMKKLASGTGHQLTASKTVPLGEHSAFCLEFSRGGKQPRSTMQCAVEGSDLYLTFEGDPRYLPDVPQVLGSMFVRELSPRP